MSRRATNVQPFIPIDTDLAPRTRHVGQAWWSMRQAGERLGFSEHTIRARIRSGDIKAQKFARSVRISEEELRRLETSGW